MTDLPVPLGTTPKASPLAYALGSLTERVNNLASERALARTSMESLPDRIMALLHPRIALLEATDRQQESRILALEAKGWKVDGGTKVVLTVLGAGGAIFGVVNYFFPHIR